MSAATGPVPICFVNYHGTMGGGQVHLLTLLDGLDRERFLPSVVCCQPGPFLEQVRRRGIEVQVIPFGKGKLRYWNIAWPAIFRFNRWLKARRVRLVQVGGLQEAKLAAWPCAWRKLPMLWVVAP